ncbi:hypothetical protein CH260_03585 [Rhodococcus sp. 05-2256-B2]|nr:hypothetical protein CH258_23115 [Rhodococcus sp. 05-2256-B4]OZD93980.1 hypothetical protein CH257_10995 [Rhodococcus sp. 05-2256-B3]OZE01078.1 hypothetical protein CH260_03585 [Rhodococcus sp. 05-2256-B2]OZE04682.1 hypothetical protein CH285_09745 [Rhodococcus sp. 05-2256-B1]
MEAWRISSRTSVARGVWRDAEFGIDVEAIEQFAAQLHSGGEQAQGAPVGQVDGAGWKSCCFDLDDVGSVSKSVRIICRKGVGLCRKCSYEGDVRAHRPVLLSW